MPGWDPFGISRRHQEVREKIHRGEEGYAQSDISGQIVSYENDEYPGTLVYGFRPVDQTNKPLSFDAIIEEMMLDVARNEGIASKGAFSKDRAEWMIKDKSRYPEHWAKKHAQAKLIKDLLTNRPELFR
jgi:hypothetical protein